MRGNMRITVARRAQMLSMMKLTNLPFLYENPKISTGFSNRHVFIASQLSTSMEFIVSCALFFFLFFFSINYTKIRGTPGAIGHHAIRDRFLQRDTRREKTVICLWKSVRIENEEFCNLSGRFVDVCEFNTVRIYIYISVVVSIVLRFKK